MRSLLAALALVAGALSLSAVTPATSEAAGATCLEARDWRAACAVHDLNADNALSAADVTVIHQVTVGIPVTLPPGTTADVDSSGHVNSTDALLLARLIYFYGVGGVITLG